MKLFERKSVKVDGLIGEIALTKREVHILQFALIEERVMILTLLDENPTRRAGWRIRYLGAAGRSDSPDRCRTSTYKPSGRIISTPSPMTRH